LSRRGNRVFTDSLAPAEWSFSTYARPFKDANSEHHAVEEALWAVMAGADKYIVSTTDGGLTSTALTAGGTSGQAGAAASSRTFATDGIATLSSVGASNAARTQGTYDVTLTAAMNSGTGAGAKVRIVEDGTTLTATILDSGASVAYAVGDTITIPAASVGGVALTFNVATVTDDFDSWILPDGTYTINPSDTNVSTSGSGVGWEFDIVIASTGTSRTFNILSAGAGFDGGDTISIPAGAFGTNTPALTITLSTHSTATSTAELTKAGSNFYRGTDPDKNSLFGPAVATPGATNNAINFGQSNRAVLGTCNLYFVMETSASKPMVYQLQNAAVNEASIDFEVDGIATINWSGFAKQIVDMQSRGNVALVGSDTATTDTSNATLVASSATTNKVVLNINDGFKLGIPTATTLTASMFAQDGGVGDTDTFIRNRLTQLLVSTTDTTAFPSGSYNLTLTGGNITISNNISYLVPEELGSVNVPIEHVTGGRTCNGNFTCYLTLDTASGNNGTSVELFNDMTTSGTNKGLEKVVNDFNVTFQVGGAVANTPRLYVNIPKCHIDVPTHSVEDVISVETNFAAYTTDFNVANEMKLEYYGV